MIKRASYRVLLVDDDLAMLETTQAVLEMAHEAIATTDALAALEQLAREEFHVLVCDWQMPAIDGIEFFRRARLIDPSAACLLITARVEDLSCEVRREDRKMLGLLGKPFSPGALLDRIDQLGRLSAMKKQVHAMKGTK